MNKRYLCLNYLLICISFVMQLKGQTKQDKNIQKISNLEALKAQIATQPDSLKLQTIHTSLKKAKYKLDTLAIADAYYFLSKISPEHQGAYTDSLIAITNGKGYASYPAKGYLRKGNIEFEKGNHKGALDFYIIGSKSAKDNGNELLYRNLKFNIGLLKNTADEREEAQIIFIEHLNFLDQNPKYKTYTSYNKVLYALADSYIHTKELDKANIYINKGIQQTLDVNDMATYSYIVVTSGIHQFLSKKYKKAIDSLQKGKNLISKFDEIEMRIATCDYYIALSYENLGETETSIRYFKEVDRILKGTKVIVPELMDTYDYLIAYSKSKQDVEKQIEYINTVLKLDSIRHTNQIYLTKNINDKYDTVELIAEKEKLINQLKEESFIKTDTISVLIVFLIIVCILAMFGFRKSYVNRKRFLKLLENKKNREDNPLEYMTNTNIDHIKKGDVDIPSEVVETVLKKLYSFEKSAKFSKKHYTLNSLAKELHTNSAYLSKIINVHKNVNFANYLNNLRIDLTIDQLTTNKALRSYTIKAIAEEVGFKNAQSFSSAFYKKTGIYPSYFIKQLESK